MPSDAPVVVIEVHIDGDWKRLGSHCEAEPCGSVSSLDPDGRQVILFGWMEGLPGVWRSIDGVDVENDAVRGVYARALEQLADLTTGPFERSIVMDTGTLRTRWRLDVDHEIEEAT